MTNVGFGYAYTTGAASNLEFAYALLEPNSWVVVGMTSGHTQETIESEVGTSREPALWFSLRNRDYVVRDPALVSRAKELVVPMQEQSARLGRLNQQQGKLSRQELDRLRSELLRQQLQVGERVGADVRHVAEEALARGKAEQVSDRERSISQPPSMIRWPGLRPRPAIDV